MAGRRRLTAGEIALARQVFAGAVPSENVTLLRGAAGNPVAAIAFRAGNSAITLRRTIHFQPAVYLADFSAAKPSAQGLLIHELTHVWQYRRRGMPGFLLRYGSEFVRCGFRAGRMYDYAPGVTAFAEATLEAQAQMAGDYAAALAAGDADRQRRLRVNLACSGLFGL